MRLAIIGSRNFNNSELLKLTIEQYFGYTHIKAITSGGSKGADSLAAQFAKTNKLELIEHLPEWDKYGKSAGFRRNRQIIENADFVLAFWDSISKGTANSLKIAKELKKPTLIYYF